MADFYRLGNEVRGKRKKSEEMQKCSHSVCGITPQNFFLLTTRIKSKQITFSHLKKEIHKVLSEHIVICCIETG
jgi:hypothetical protein